MIYTAPSTTFEAIADGFATGLVGTIGIRVRDNAGNDTIARTTAGIAEDIAGSGIYRAQFTAPAVAGQYTIVWDNASGTYATEDLIVSYSAPSGAPPSGSDLCTVADVRAALEIPTADTSRDTLIATLITAASEAIMGEVDREFAPATASATRRFRVDGFKLNLSPYDLRTVTAITMNPETASPTTLTVTSDYQLLPIGAPSGTYTSLAFSSFLASLYASNTLYAFGYAMVDINGAWGFAAVPRDVNRACVITVGSWLRKDVSMLLAAGELDLGGGLAPAFPTTLEIPNNAKRLLGPFYRLSSMVAV